MNNQFVLLHNADDKEAPVWINMSLVIRIDEYQSGSKLLLVGGETYFYSAEKPSAIIDTIKS